MWSTGGDPSDARMMADLTFVREVPSFRGILETVLGSLLSIFVVVVDFSLSEEGLRTRLLLVLLSGRFCFFSVYDRNLRNAFHTGVSHCGGVLSVITRFRVYCGFLCLV